MVERDDSSRIPEPYCRAARFDRERDGLRAYTTAQELIFQTPCDLSAYRLQLSRIWHVAVVGEAPPEDIDRRIERILARGQVAELPEEVIKLLLERSAQIRSQAPWTEGHYRPGLGT